MLYRVTVYLYSNMCCIVSLCTCIPKCAVSLSLCTRIPTCALSCHCVPVYQNVLYRVTAYLYSNMYCIVLLCTCIKNVLFRVTVYLYTKMCYIVSLCTCIPKCAVSCHCVPVYQNVLYRVTMYLYTNMCCIVSQKTEIFAFHLKHFSDLKFIPSPL